MRTHLRHLLAVAGIIVATSVYSQPVPSSNASGLKTTGAPVNASSSAPPAGSGYACITTDATHCTWQLASGSGVPTSRTVSTTSPLGGGGALSGNLTLTCAACATSSSDLSFFASTTSAQLRGVLSDETGSGAAVFATGPTITSLVPTFTDVTTGNMSTSAHGLAPKGDGNAAHYLDGTGAYSTPGGGSAPFADDVTAALVKGTADATKLFGINLAGMTTGNHAVATVTGTTAAPVLAWPGTFTATNGFLGSERFGLGSVCTTNNCSAFGAGASGGASGTAIGQGASAGANSTALGQGANAGGTAGIAIGQGSNAPGNGSIALGCSATAQSAHNGLFGGSAASNCNVTNVFFGGGINENATPMVTLQSTWGNGTNSAGSDMGIGAGKGSGNAAAGNLRLQSAPPGASGSSYGSYVDRVVIKAAPISLTSGSAAVVDDISLATLTMTGGKIEYTITCSDGTDMQALTGTVIFSAVNKGGSYTTSITSPSGGTADDTAAAKAVSAGTLTLAWSVVSGTNKVQIKATATTSLTPTSFKLYAIVVNDSEQGLN